MLVYILIGGLVLLLIVVIIFIAVFFSYQKKTRVDYMKIGKDYINYGVDTHTGKFVKEGKGFMPYEKQKTYVLSQNNCVYVRVTDLMRKFDYGTLVLNTPKIIGSMTGNADLKIPGDKYISAVHCKLYSHNWIVYIDDLNSRNGTYLNERKIEKGAIVNNNDMINIGNTFLKLEIIMN